MAKRFGFGKYQYEVVENWPKVPIRGAVYGGGEPA